MLQFVREIPIQVIVQKASSERRGFLFYVAAGFSKEINPLSGMTVNLTQVDKWLQDLKKDLEKEAFVSSAENINQALSELLTKSRLQLAAQAQTEKATLVSLQFREERSWSFSWSEEQEGELFKYDHFLEVFPKSPQEFALLKIEFCWRRALHCEVDLRHEGFKILKELTAKNHRELREKLQNKIGICLANSSELSMVIVHYVGINQMVILS